MIPVSPEHVVVILLWTFTVKGNSAYTVQAQCDVLPNPEISVALQEQVKGTIYFNQDISSSIVTIKVHISGFNTSDNYTKHGFHVHETGDVSTGCSHSGGHYNPSGVNHGGKTDTIRHVGDLGNIQEDSNGQVSVIITDSIALLTGPHSIIGKAMVIHQKPDDLGRGGDSGSITSGNAGTRIACCIIQETNSAKSVMKASLRNTVTIFCITVLVFIRVHY